MCVCRCRFVSSHSRYPNSLVQLIVNSVRLVQSMVSAVDQAKRALVTLLKLLATAYSCVLLITRDSSDQEIKTAYRKLSKKHRRFHPCHGSARGEVGSRMHHQQQ